MHMVLNKIVIEDKLQIWNSGIKKYFC